MFKKSLYYIIILIAITFLIAPRILLFSLGPDTKRLSDASLLPTSLEILSSAKEGSLHTFLSDDHKYPLLGSYLLSPSIITHYLKRKIDGTFETPADFVRSYALRETNLYQFVEAEMLLINFLAIVLIIYTARKFISAEYSKNATTFALLLSALSSYALFFSVTPRIHSFLFFFTAITLYASFNLAEKKSVLNYTLAFGSAALAFASGQTGITNFVMPVLAHFTSSIDGRLLWSLSKKKLFSKILWLSLFIAIVLSILIGYPRVIFTLANLGQNSATISNSFLSQKHPNPPIGLGGISHFLYHSYPTSELAPAFASIIALYFFIRRKNKLTIHETIAGFHIVSFLSLSLIFSGIYSGYFVLAVLPSIFFLTASLMARLANKKMILATFITLLLIQGLMIILISKVFLGGDTIYYAHKYILEKTSANEKILSSINNHILNLPITEEILATVSESELSSADKLIKSNGFKNANTRYIDWASDPSRITDGKFEPRQYSWIIFSGDKEVTETKKILCSKGFTLAQIFLSHPENKQEMHQLLSLPFVWDIKKLSFVRATGPNIYIFKKGECRLTSLL